MTSSCSGMEGEIPASLYLGHCFTAFGCFSAKAKHRKGCCFSEDDPVCGSASSHGGCPVKAESLPPLSDPQGPSAPQGRTCRGGTTATRVARAFGSGSEVLFAARLRTSPRCGPDPSRPVRPLPSRRPPSATCWLAGTSLPRPTPLPG